MEKQSKTKSGLISLCQAVAYLSTSKTDFP